MSQILYCNATDDPRQAGYIDPGHWFFDTGHWVVCASAYDCGDGTWGVDIMLDSGKPATPPKLRSVDDCKAFVSQYFEAPVVDVEPSDFPAPDDL